MRAAWRVPLVPLVFVATGFAACGGSSRSPEPEASDSVAGDAGAPAEFTGGNGSGGRESTVGVPSGGAEMSGGASATGGSPVIPSGGTVGGAGEAGAPEQPEQGGQPVGGVASAGGRPWIVGGNDDGDPVPENCRAVRRQEIAGTTACFITFGCDDAEVSGNCEADPDGRYLCRCSDGQASRTYRVTSPDPLTACDTVDQVCGSARGAQEPGSCVRSIEYENVETCEIDEQCQRPIETSDGEAATLSEDRKVTCVDDGTLGSLSCAYYGGNLNPREYFVSGADGRTACEAVLAFASERSDRAFTEPRLCTRALQEVATDACRIAETCTRPLELEGGVLLELRSSQGVSCERFGSETNCSCGSELGAIVFWTRQSPGDIETCEQAFEPCLVEGALELEGSASCERGTQYAEDNVCTTEFECFQPASLHGNAIREYVGLGLRCSQLDVEHPWVCTCSGETISSYEVEAAEAWEACEEGATICLEKEPRNEALGF